MLRSILSLSALFCVLFGSMAAAQETITPEMLAAADETKGKRVFLRCRSCHTLEEGGRNLTGPNLWGVFGRKVGGLEGYRYSNAVLAADFIWTPDKLNEWLLKPKDFLPGNKMSFVGLPKEQDRVNLIYYLQVQTGAVVEAPAAAEPAVQEPAATTNGEAAVDGATNETPVEGATGTEGAPVVEGSTAETSAETAPAAEGEAAVDDSPSEASAEGEPATEGEEPAAPAPEVEESPAGAAPTP